MPLEIIRRKEGEISQKQEIRHKNVQISINDWGHLCIREFDEPQLKFHCEIGHENCANGKTTAVCRDLVGGYQCKHCKEIRSDDEHLIVFDKTTTEKIINFIFSIRSTYEFKQFLKDLTDKKNELPF